LLEALGQKHFISPADASALSKAHLAYRGAIYVVALEGLEPKYVMRITRRNESRCDALQNHYYPDWSRVRIHGPRGG
jgi:hypothetical protein